MYIPCPPPRYMVLLSTTGIPEQKQGLIFKQEYESLLSSMDFKYIQLSWCFQQQISVCSPERSQLLLSVSVFKWNIFYLLITLLELLWMESSWAACSTVFKGLKSLFLPQHFLVLISLSDLTSSKSRVSLALGSKCERPKCLIRTMTQVCSHLLSKGFVVS